MCLMWSLACAVPKKYSAYSVFNETLLTTWNAEPTAHVSSAEASTAAHRAGSRKERREVNFVMTFIRVAFGSILFAGCTANRAPVDAPPYGALGFPVTSTSVQVVADGVWRRVIR